MQLPCSQGDAAQWSRLLVGLAVVGAVEVGEAVVAVGEAEVGATVDGWAVGEAVLAVGAAVGAHVSPACVGRRVGRMVGARVVGARVGAKVVGVRVGAAVGLHVFAPQFGWVQC